MKYGTIFDMDGVIVDNNLYHEKAWLTFLEKYQLKFTDSDFKKHIFGKTNGDALNFIFNNNLEKKNVDKFSLEKEIIYRQIYKPFITPVKGLLSFLQNLKSRQISIALASSAPKENINFILNNLKIRDYFDVIVDGESIKKGKPNPEIFLKAAKELNIDPEYCVVFEDSLSGVESALNAGMKVIGICTTHIKSELKHVITAINNFEDIEIELFENILYDSKKKLV